MRYEMMFPQQLKEVYEKRLPLLLPIGTLEFHGPHCAYGCDGLIARGLAERLEMELPVVILPTFWYGVSSYAVGGPETGTVNVETDALFGVMRDLFTSLLEGGARNIVAMIHHQYEQESYMPTTLAVASAAKVVTMKLLENTRGRGWWGSNAAADYYNQLDTRNNPFNWIRVLPCMSSSVQNATGYDHAGKYESSILSALYPEAVQLDNLNMSDAWFIQSAYEASREYGEEMARLCIADLKEKIKD